MYFDLIDIIPYPNNSSKNAIDVIIKITSLFSTGHLSIISPPAKGKIIVH